MNDENQIVREKAVQAIGDICGLGDACGISEVELLLEELKDQSKGVRWRASNALVKIGSASVEPLIAMLADKDPDIKIRAAKSLGELGDERAVEPLTRLLKDNVALRRSQLKRKPLRPTLTFRKSLAKCAI
jgi:HEAT repeat protein